jgi:glycerol kinase
VEFVGDGDEALQLAAVVESIAFLLRVNLDAMGHAALLRGARVSGGMARCDYLCQALADLCGLAVNRHAVGEATARGVAFLAAGEPSDWQAVPVERAFAPRPNGPLAARYDRWLAEMARRGAVAP